jgi:hypothetical protein
MTIKGTMVRAALALSVISAAACDTKVTNPGPVQDPFLDEPAAQAAVVAGIGRALAQATNWIAYTGAAVTREIHPAGSTGSFGITPQWQRGELDSLNADLNTHWEQGQQARWFAENGLSRMEAAVPDSARLQAQAALYAGYANRLMGENMCAAVFDGGPLEASTKFFERAETYFTKAYDKGTGNVKTAALAGRAAARVGLGKWTEAVADAGQVASSFTYALPYYDVGSEAQRNRIQWAIATTPYKAHTQWNTWIAAYFDQTSDPRVKYRKTNGNGDAAIECCGPVPFYPQDKYTTPAAAITLSSGSEMRLIEAENQLRSGNFAAAVTAINALRTTAGVPAVTATNLTDAWTALKRERGIVLWLEARRMGDLRRWKAANTPGALNALETPSGDAKVGSHLVKQDLCFPVPRSERDTNPNLR